MRSRTKGYIAGGMTIAAFTVGGAAFGNEVYYHEEVRAGNEEVEVSQSELDEIRDHQVELDYDRDSIEESLGESCLRLVRAYMPDGALAGTDENVIIDDLLREPGLPCGDSATEIRTDVRNLMSAEAAIAENEARYDEMSNGHSKDDEEESNDGALGQAGNIAFGTALGGILGVVVGSAVGMITEEKSLNNPRKKREYNNHGLLK